MNKLLIGPVSLLGITLSLFLASPVFAAGPQPGAYAPPTPWMGAPPVARSFPRGAYFKPQVRPAHPATLHRVSAAPPWLRPAPRRAGSLNRGMPPMAMLPPRQPSMWMRPPEPRVAARPSVRAPHPVAWGQPRYPGMNGRIPMRARAMPLPYLSSPAFARGPGPQGYAPAPSRGFAARPPAGPRLAWVPPRPMPTGPMMARYIPRTDLYGPWTQARAPQRPTPTATTPRFGAMSLAMLPRSLR